MDDYVRNVFNGEADKRDAVSLQKYRWRARTIYYEFKPDIGNILRLKLHDNSCLCQFNTKIVMIKRYSFKPGLFHCQYSWVVTCLYEQAL